MKTALIVSSLPPPLCGIASYATEQARFLEQQGSMVIRISPIGHDGRDHDCGFSNASGILCFLRHLAGIRFDRLFLHYADKFFFPWPDNLAQVSRPVHMALRILQTAGLAIIGMTAGKRGEVIIHEISMDRRMPTRVRFFRGLALSCFARLTFHSRAHLDAVVNFYPFLRRTRAHTVSHHRFMRRNFQGTKGDALEQLCIPGDFGQLFLCIGFWNPTKGFEYAIDAFTSAKPHYGMLCIVGSPGASSDSESYAAMLTSRIPPNARIHLVQKKLNDEEFDRWIQAADVVVLPYLSISSSGVAARASLYGKKLILRDLPEFREEYPSAVFFQSKEELTKIFTTRAHTH